MEEPEEPQESKDEATDETTEATDETTEATDEATEATKSKDDDAPATGKEDDRKVFIGGLSWSTKEPALREYFGKYGEITSINIKTDPHTGKSRGFAFVVFKEPSSVDKVIEEKTHTIDGRKVEPSKAKKRTG